MLAIFDTKAAGSIACPREICQAPSAMAPNSTTYCAPSAIGMRLPMMTLRKPISRSTATTPIKAKSDNVRLCRVVCGGPRNA